jgi:hypothetical protein
MLDKNKSTFFCVYNVSRGQADLFRLCLSVPTCCEALDAVHKAQPVEAGDEVCNNTGTGIEKGLVFIFCPAQSYNILLRRLIAVIRSYSPSLFVLF